jgi:hypothetical protein
VRCDQESKDHISQIVKELAGCLLVSHGQPREASREKPEISTTLVCRARPFKKNQNDNQLLIGKLVHC